ncbi:MAG: hypothetical protein GXP01_02260 [Alphaproteobacteria bacterium]|nr:hypothetical protein [Alphaproteobacteria bacterium]
MTAILIRLLVFAALFGVIYIGVRAIKRQWMAHFRAIGDQRRQEDKVASKAPEVIDLKRSGDGVFRPNDADGKTGPETGDTDRPAAPGPAKNRERDGET